MHFSFLIMILGTSNSTPYIKAKVFIYENGQVVLQTFVKKQTTGVEQYIRHHLSKFEVSKKMLENGYVQAGEQCVQLRCLHEKLKGK